MASCAALDETALRSALARRCGDDWLDNLEFRVLDDPDAGVCVEVASLLPAMIDRARGRHFGAICAEIHHLLSGVVEISFEDAA